MEDWPYLMFVVAGMYMAVSITHYFLLTTDPRKVGLPRPNQSEEPDPTVNYSGIVETEQDSDEEPIIASLNDTMVRGSGPLTHYTGAGGSEYLTNRRYSTRSAASEGRITWFEAITGPSVAVYALISFGVKFSIYAVLLWMPLLLGSELGYDLKTVGGILSLYEISACIGIIFWGTVSDKCNGRRSPVIFIAVLLSTIFFFLLGECFKEATKNTLTAMMIVLGFCLGSYHLLAVTIAADIGARYRGKKATSTISGIIDGAGGLGTATGSLAMSVVIDKFGF
jgi:sugar phosphate permease